MVNFKAVKLNKWQEKRNPVTSGYKTGGWLSEMNLAFVDKTKTYCVMIRKVQTEWGEMEHACIRNIQGTDICWSEKQRIKNEIFGFDATAIEVFPTEKNLVDAANMYHLWILPNKFELPFGIQEGF